MSRKYATPRLTHSLAPEYVRLWSTPNARYNNSATPARLTNDDNQFNACPPGLTLSSHDGRAECRRRSYAEASLKNVDGSKHRQHQHPGGHQQSQYRQDGRAKYYPTSTAQHLPACSLPDGKIMNHHFWINVWVAELPIWQNGYQTKCTRKTA